MDFFQAEEKRDQFYNLMISNTSQDLSSKKDSEVPIKGSQFHYNSENSFSTQSSVIEGNFEKESNISVNNSTYQLPSYELFSNFQQKPIDLRR